MSLDPQAAVILDEIRRLMPVQMSDLPVGVLRRALEDQPSPPAPAVFQVRDLSVPTATHAVPVRVYRPSDEQDLPMLLWLHGGGFALGSIEMYDSLCRELACAAGVIVVSVGYRLAPEHPFPAGLNDSYAALEWLTQAGAEFGGDPSRVAVGGDSAGGTLAIACSLMARDRAGALPAFQLIVYGTGETRVTNPEFGDLPVLTAQDCEWFWGMYAPAEEDRTSPYCSPLLAEDLSGLPPAFIITAEHDPTRDGTEALAHRLAAAGVTTALKRYPGMFHGFFSATTALARAREALHDAATALRGNLAAERSEVNT